MTTAGRSLDALRAEGRVRRDFFGPRDHRWGLAGEGWAEEAA